MSEKIKTTIYLHADKESNYEQGEELGLTGEALNYFMYACYEVGIDVEVDKETGETIIVGVDGRTLTEEKQ